MKNTLAIFCFALFAFSAAAQPGPFPPEKFNNDEFVKMQIAEIVNWLNLEGKTKDRFVTEYTAFRSEMDAVAKNATPPQHIENEDEIEKAILNNFDVSEKILQIRKKYYSRFREFLRPSQIQRMYFIENEAGRRMHRPHGMPGGPNGFEGRPAPPKPDDWH